MIGVIGPNGAGKTTLFNMISGIHAPTAGRIRLAGTDITHEPVHRRAKAGLGRTFQTSNLFPGLSVLENVRLSAQRRLGGNLSVLRFPRRGDDASREAADPPGGGGPARAGRRPRRAGCPTATSASSRSPSCSPWSPRSSSWTSRWPASPAPTCPGLSEVIRRLHRSHGCTVLMVEHHIDVVLGLVERVAVLHQGTILALDEPGAIMADPLVQSAYLGAAV